MGKKATLVFVTASVLFALDRVLKSFLGEFSDVCNAGISFGLFHTAGFWLSIAGILIFFGILFLCERHLARWEFFLGAGILFAGAVSNILDRIYFGCVRDMFHFFGWFVFNTSDILLSIGAGLMALGIFMNKEK